MVRKSARVIVQNVLILASNFLLRVTTRVMTYTRINEGDTLPTSDVASSTTSPIPRRFFNRRRSHVYSPFCMAVSNISLSQ